MFRKFSAERNQARTRENGAAGKAPKACASAGCQGVVAEPWESNGLYCPVCAIELYLFDRDARWENQIPLLQAQGTTQPEVIRKTARPASALSRLFKQASVLLGISPDDTRMAVPPGQGDQAGLRSKGRSYA